MTEPLVVCNGAKICKNFKCPHRHTHYRSHLRDSGGDVCTETYCEDSYFFDDGTAYNCICVPYTKEIYDLLPTTKTEAQELLYWTDQDNGQSNSEVVEEWWEMYKREGSD